MSKRATVSSTTLLSSPRLLGFSPLCRIVVSKVKVGICEPASLSMRGEIWGVTPQYLLTDFLHITFTHRVYMLVSSFRVVILRPSFFMYFPFRTKIFARAASSRRWMSVSGLRLANDCLSERDVDLASSSFNQREELVTTIESAAMP